ncbi:MAG: hypothetical protein P9M03_03060 [Candidatus Theseobacter exili]|nr:hypothetical protein [Candidatus Theseobacter exili]
MNKDIIIAQVRRQQAEMKEMIESVKELTGGGLNEILKEAFEERLQSSDHLIETLQDESIIPHGQERTDVQDDINKFEKDMGKARQGVKKIKKLEQEKEKIKKDLFDVTKDGE